MDKHHNGNPITWDQLTDLCTAYQRAWVALRESSDEIRKAQRLAAERSIQQLKRRADELANASAKLRLAVTQVYAQGMFLSPRTRVFDGIRVGVRAIPGAVEVSDEAAAIARIRAALPDRAAQLVGSHESLDRVALRRLSADELNLIGVRIVGAGPEIVARPVGTDTLEERVKMLLDDAEKGS